MHSCTDIHTYAHTPTHTHTEACIHVLTHLHALWAGSMVLSPPCTGTEMWGKRFNSQTWKTAS